MIAWMAKTPLVALLALAMTVGGCSLVFVEGPPPLRERRRQLDCTTSSALPFVDLTLSVASLLTVLGVAATPHGAFGGTSTSRIGIASGGLILGGLTATSAGVGFWRVSACNEANDETGASSP